MRLIAAGGSAKPPYRTGIAITMMPGAHTYWKQPGDAGVPPVFAFNGSSNVAKAEVLFPVPTRIREDGLDTFGYKDSVTFPVTVTTVDASKPAVLRLQANYAVCDKICVPAQASAELRLPAQDGAADPELAKAFAAVPKPLPDAEAGDLTLARDPKAAKPTWIISWTGKERLTDIFPEAPEGYAFDTSADGPNRWRLVAAQVVTAPKNETVPVTLTLAGPQSFVAQRTLDLAKP